MPVGGEKGSLKREDAAETLMSLRLHNIRELRREVI